MMAEKTDKEIKSLLVQANSAFQSFRYREDFFRSSTVYELYEALGFPVNIGLQDYIQKYERQDIAHRIVKAPVDGTWVDNPRIFETDDKETRFEKDLALMIKNLKLYPVLKKVDLLASLGRYAILFIAVMDNRDPSLPIATSNEGISYISAIPEDRAEITAWDEDLNSPRFGLPESYSITINTEVTSSISRTVHWSRIIHIAENTLDSDIYGIPALKPVYNRLMGLEKLAGGSPEMYWRGARPLFVAQAEDNLTISDDQLEALKEQLSSFVNNMNRYIYSEGMKISSLSPQVVSPMEHIDAQLKLISAATRIPMRILIGSERGELASSQDARSWLSYLEERREHVASQLIVRPTIDRLIDLGAITAPLDDYSVEWEPLLTLSEIEKADVALKQQQTIKTWSETIGGELICPPEFLLKSLGKSDEEIELQLNVGEYDIKTEDRERQNANRSSNDEDEKGDQ